MRELDVRLFLDAYSKWSETRKPHLTVEELSTWLTDAIAVIDDMVTSSKIIEKFSASDVSEIRLLSKDEWFKASEIKEVPVSNGPWWLRDSAPAGEVLCAYGRGSLGSRYVYQDYGVRPVLRIPSMTSNVGEKVYVGNTFCTVISSNLALSDIVIAQRMFDKYSNKYDESSIKEYVDFVAKGML